MQQRHKETKGLGGRKADQTPPVKSSFRQPRTPRPQKSSEELRNEAKKLAETKDKKKLKQPTAGAEIITITPPMAVKMLEMNTWNRPLKQQHIDRIAGQITQGKWKYNGATIKIATNHDILDGQHRLWACIMADKPIMSLVVYGIARDAFVTIDTIQAVRSGGDTLALMGVLRHRREIASALAWLLRWQRGTLVEYKSAKNRIENSDTEEAFGDHSSMVDAVDRVRHCKGLLSVAITGFLYYIMASRDMELAERFLNTLESPAGVAVNDPFFRFRAWLLQSIENKRRREPIMLIALAFKAWNMAKDGRQIEYLSWRNQGPTKEKFPTLS